MITQIVTYTLWYSVVLRDLCVKKKRNKKPQHRVHRDTQRYTEVKDDNREVPLIEGERGCFSAPQIGILCGTLWYSVISV